MKTGLIAINAKYIHSNLAVYSLKKYYEVYSISNGNDVEILEYTINQPKEVILQKIVEAEADVLCFSCYIWNIEIIGQIISDLAKIYDGEIWLGGPEVSFNSEYYMNKYTNIKGIMRGEGEQIFTEVLDSFSGVKKLSSISGITYRTAYGGLNTNSEVIKNPDAKCLDFSKIPFPYSDLTEFENRIIYYETSRGCPFSCAYCLSSLDKQLRFRSMEQIKSEILFFLNNKVPQVKLVDRTFNCDHKRSIEILEYIKEKDNGITNFHFEIAGDILTDKEMEILESLRPGLVQLEIGVQSTNPHTLEAIHRKNNMSVLKANVKRLLKNQNIHIHLDLIAGLPYEDLSSFINSFNELYLMNGHELQLGFLKMLKGTSLTAMRENYGIEHSDKPPYEVLKTKYISYKDLTELKRVEEMLEIYHNSAQFVNAEKYIIGKYNSPYEYYKELADYYKKMDYSFIQSSRTRKYEILLEYWQTKNNMSDGRLVELLTLDYYLRENPKKRPDFCKTEDSDRIKEFYTNEKIRDTYLAKFVGMDLQKIKRITHVEFFTEDSNEAIFFDYSRIHPVTHCAGTYRIKID